MNYIKCFERVSKYVWTALTILSFLMLLHAPLPHSMTGKETDTTSESDLMVCSYSVQ